MLEDDALFYSLKKHSRTPHEDHLVTFHRLVNRINYSRANGEIPDQPLTKEKIELAFSRSLH
jgi:hypothetical protein